LRAQERPRGLLPVPAGVRRLPAAAREGAPPRRSRAHHRRSRQRPDDAVDGPLARARADPRVRARLPPRARPGRARHVLRRRRDARRGVRRAAVGARHELPRSPGLIPVRELIRRKRDGEALTPDELAALVSGVTDGSIPDYQAAAFLMAVFFRGMSEAELVAWTEAMVRSGEVLDLSAVGARKIDKHSTGGVGARTSLPPAPAAAACGVAVPMVSGRGLGHTGGTLDKLESIPGFRVDLSTREFAAQVAKIGCCLIGQTEKLAPADRKLYALRDVT